MNRYFYQIWTKKQVLKKSESNYKFLCLKKSDLKNYKLKKTEDTFIKLIRG